MKKLAITIFVLFLTMGLWAIPARKGTATRITLENGQTVSAMLVGDEYAHWWETADGTKIMPGDNGKGRIMTVLQSEAMQQKAAEKRMKANLRRVEKLNRAARKVGSVGTYEGKKKGLVILVNFKDREMKTQQTVWDDMFNKEGYSDNNHIGSVHDYFKDQSYGRFDLSFDVVGPVTLSQRLAYYGGTSAQGGDEKLGDLAAEACNLVDGDVNFADYDWDGDGEVDQVYIVYAGYGQNVQGAENYLIWPQESTLEIQGTGKQTLDGKTVNTFAVSSELSGLSGNTPNGIGLACHEFAHCLGYPDFYDGLYAGHYGMGAWDLLCSGSYNGPRGIGEVPVGFTAYEKMMAGWLTPTEIDTDLGVPAMQDVNSTPEAYVIYNSGKRDEYYLFENRKPERWYSYWDTYKATKQGMLIVHVDYDRNIWEMNVPNTVVSAYGVNNDHERMTFFSASNRKGTYMQYYENSADDYAGHLYPYGSNNSLTAESQPAATLFNYNASGRKMMDIELTDIKVNADGTMGFKSTKVEQEGQKEGDTVFYESFDKCASTGGNDGKWDGDATSGAPAMDNDGWTYHYGYAGSKCVRFGTKQRNAYAVTPDFLLNGTARLTFKAGELNTKNDVGTEVTVSQDGKEIGKFAIDKGSWTEISTTITANGMTNLSFETQNRMLLDEVKVVLVGTGIDSEQLIVNSEQITVNSEQVFNQNGQRVSEYTRGIVIKNGKKILR